ncbi:hypothetical protein E4M00_06065 [Leifsonia flava]|uniref:DUF7144 domain-containing protein n=2 Tax=Orlajensenia leifsoniae TaxID=2561933 RepID=A0A4Y9R465_9MICO|nr:hypothetical protein E4M00_06065 [Leifsonia flava]
MAELMRRSRWEGWVRLAIILLILNGLFNLLQGFFALIGSNTYSAVVDGSLVPLDLTLWGWWNIIVGIVLIAAGIALTGGSLWARVITVIAASLSAITQLLLMPTQPWSALIVFVVDVLIIYAVAAHGRVKSDHR